MEWLEFCKTFIPKIKSQYKARVGKELNLENPQSFTEKIQWMKIYDSTYLKTFCADKILLHDYCEMKLGKNICIPILATYDKPEEIEWEKLPNSFVIKCNHGSGYNIIINDKSKVNRNDVNAKLRTWLNENYALLGSEMHYYNIKRKILIEVFMKNDGKVALTDYKFSCFNGEPKFCQVMNDRFTNRLHFNYYDMNFNPMLDVSRNDHPANYSIKDEKPELWDLMIEYSKKLSDDFKFVRVDFYQINGKVYLGELTFTPGDGYVTYKNKDTDNIFGKMLHIQ